MDWLLDVPTLFLMIDFRSQNLLHRARFEKNTRYFSLSLLKDLLEDWVVVADNGRIGSKLGQRRTKAFPTYQQAFDHLCSQATLRHKRDYRCVAYSANSYFFEDLCQTLALTIPAIEKRSVKAPVYKKTTPKIKKVNLDAPNVQQYSFCF